MIFFKKNTLLSIGLFIAIQGHLLSQNTNNTQCLNRWNYGYVILKNGTEKTYGFIKTKGTSDIKAVKFRKDLHKSKNTLKAYKSDTIQYFGYCDKNYKWVNYTDTNYRIKIHVIGWIPIKEQGKITLCSVPYKLLPTKDSSASSTTISWELKKKLPTMYYLNKELEKDILLLDEFVNDDSVLSVSSKNNLLSLIADNVDLYKQWMSEKITITNVPKIVHLYNESNEGSYVSKKENTERDKSEKTHQEFEEKTENTSSAPQENSLRKVKKLHHGLQYSIIFGTQIGHNKANLNGIGNVIFYNAPSTYLEFSAGYGINNWAFGFVYSYNNRGNRQVVFAFGGGDILKTNRSISNPLFQNIHSIDNTFNGLYVRKYFMPINAFISVEAGMGRFVITKYVNHDNNSILHTNYGFEWKTKVGKEFLIFKKYSIGGYISLTGIQCQYIVYNSKNTFSYYALGACLFFSFN
jgi:hypothetical protein